jgi:hypothetical protein
MGCELEPEYREQLFRFADAISHDFRNGHRLRRVGEVTTG